jgi:uncharacterized membrane protein
LSSFGPSDDLVVAPPRPGDGQVAAPPLAWARLPLPIVKLCAAGFSVALFIQLCVMKSTRNPFLGANVLGKASRQRLLLSLGVGLLAPLLLLVPLLWRRPRDASRVERAADLVGPLAVLFLLVPLTSVSFSRESQLLYVLLLGMFALCAEPLLRRSFDAVRWLRARYALLGAPYRLRWWSRPWLPFVLVVLAALAYGVFNSYYTILTHHRLGTTAFDLGIYDNLMWNAMHGHPFRSPVLFGPAGGNYIAGHAEFAMLLFVPIYALHPGPEMMLILQSFMLGLAAIPLYLFAATQLPRGISALVAVGYLFFAPLHGPNYYDFHWLPLAIFFHFWLFYGIARRKTWLIVLTVLILFAVREDLAVGVAALGAFLLFTRVRPRLGFVLVLSSIAWFVIDRFVIMPRAGEWFFQNFYNELFADGEATYAGVVKTLVTNPIFVFWALAKLDKLQYALHMLAPVAFLPVRRLSTAMLMLPGFFFTLLSSYYPPVLSIAFQYTTHWIPFLFAGVVLGLVLLERRSGPHARQAAVATFAIVLGCHSLCFGALLQHEHFVGGFQEIQFKAMPLEKQRYADLRALTALIPASASVAATENELPHVSTRRIVYTFRQSPGPVDYLLVGRSHLGGGLSFLIAAFDTGTYGLVGSKSDELYLFKRGPKLPGTDEAKAKLGVPVPPPTPPVNPISP